MTSEAYSLLLHAPSYKNTVDLDSISGYEWRRLIIKHPHLENGCPWKNLLHIDIFIIGSYQPQFKYKMIGTLLIYLPIEDTFPFITANTYKRNIL